MTIHEFKKVSLLNVPQKLRELADRLEQLGEPFSVVCVIGRPNGRVSVRAFGERTDSLNVAGWLARGQTYMTEDAGEEDLPLLGPPPPAS